jgi:predicted ATP-binding protein involved in virulence
MSEKETNKNFSYFYKLELEGINCFRDKQTIDLSNGNGNYAPWTIILGNNGTGKTTLLRALDRMQPYNRVLEDKSYIIPIYTLNLKTINHQIVKSYLISNDDITYVSFEGKKGNGTSTIKDYQMFLISFGASRRMSKSQNISSTNEDDMKLTSLFDDSIELINAEEWLLQKELLSEKAELSVKQKFDNQLKLVKNILVSILPDVEEIRVKPINESNSKLLLEVRTPYGWVNLRDLSHGYQTTTALIVDIAAKMMEQYPDSENPLAEPVIILIDEIDLHLHPKWQRTVLDKLSYHFPAAQFIATSHSPLIVQSAQDKGANIVVCRKEGDRVIIDNDPDEVKGWRIDQILVSDLFELDSSRSVKTQKKVDQYIEFKGVRNGSGSAGEGSGILEGLDSEPETELDKKLKEFANKYLK